MATSVFRRVLNHADKSVWNIYLVYLLVYSGICKTRERNVFHQNIFLLIFYISSHTGIAINGQLVSGKKMKNNKLNTYFGTISIYTKAVGLNIVVSTSRIDLLEGKNNHSFSWGATANLILKRYKNVHLKNMKKKLRDFSHFWVLSHSPHYICMTSLHAFRLHIRATVSIKKESKLTVTIDGKISVTVLLHRVWKKHPFNVDFLGFYTPSINQYSSQVHGLIGVYEVLKMFVLSRAEKDVEVCSGPPEEFPSGNTFSSVLV